MTLLILSQMMLWVLMLALSAAVFAIYRHIGFQALGTREGRMNQGPPDGERLPVLDLRTVADDVERVGGTAGGVVYLFGATHCPTCRVVLPEFAKAAPDISARHLRPVYITDGTPEEVRAIARTLPSAVGILRDQARLVARRVGIHATPFVIVTDDKGRITGRGSPRQARDFVTLVAAFPTKSSV